MAFGVTDPCSPNCASCAAITPPKPLPYCDYSMAMKEFAEALIKLHNHIEQHDLIADAEDVCRDIRMAVTFLMSPDGHGTEKDRDKQWKQGWNLIRDNIRGWWD